MDEVFEHEASIGRAEPVADACPAPPLPGGNRREIARWSVAA